MAVDQMTKQIGPQNIAAIVIEPIQGEGGFIVPGRGFLPVLAEFCAENDIVFVADEIQTGFGRTGDWFACEDEGIVPDLITTAKGIAGGLPLAAVTGRADLMDAPHVGGLGGTYGGNPVACAAALGAIRTIESQDLVGRARHIGEVMLPRLRAMAERHGSVGDVRGRGAMVAIELVDPETGAPDAALTSKVAAHAAANGVLALTCGTYGNVIRFLPPLTISDELLIEGLGVVAEGLRTA